MAAAPPYLTVAIPNKGSLSETCVALLREAGYRQRADSRDLAVVDDANGVEFFYLRPRDIAVYVGQGTLDVGVTGRDLLIDSQAAAHEVLPLGFGGSTFRFAARPGRVSSLDDLAGVRIATSYPALVAGYLAERGVQAQITRLDGAVETAVRLGVADVIADVVSTGATLRQAGLEVVLDPILSSEAVVIRRNGAPDPDAGSPATDALHVLIRRVQGVLTARAYVMLDYDIPADAVEAACAVTPGIESPTVAPLRRDGWFAVRAMVERRAAQRTMDVLWELGARGILATDIHACRL